jgi:hypothetical protein
MGSLLVCAGMGSPLLCCVMSEAPKSHHPEHCQASWCQLHGPVVAAGINVLATHACPWCCAAADCSDLGPAGLCMLHLLPSGECQKIIGFLSAVLFDEVSNTARFQP